MTRRLVLAGLMLGPLWTTPCLADHRVGNGGDAVVCRENGDIKSVQLLDFYEARLLRGTVPALGEPLLAPLAKAKLALARIARFDPERAAAYTAVVDSFYAEARFLVDAQLEDVPDSNHLALPRGCTIEQLAIQRTPSFPDEPRYLIDDTLWQKMDDEGRAGLILHETIYREAIRRGQGDSVAARYLTAYVASEKLDAATQAQYDALIRVVGFHAEHWFDQETGWRWALLPAGNAGDDWGAARQGCAEIGGGYRLPTIRELVFANRSLATSRLASELLGPESEVQMPAQQTDDPSSGSPVQGEDPPPERGDANPSFSVLLWSSSRDSVGNPCAGADPMPVKVMRFFANGEPGEIETVCTIDKTPFALCLARPD
jgi:hypothetical protein